MRQLHRIESAALIGVDEVYAGCFDRKTNLARRGLRDWNLLDHKSLRTAGFMDAY
jgi:hypothetical protein